MDTVVGATGIIKQNKLNGLPLAIESTVQWNITKADTELYKHYKLHSDSSPQTHIKAKREMHSFYTHPVTMMFSSGEWVQSSLSLLLYSPVWTEFCELYAPQSPPQCALGSVSLLVHSQFIQ